MPGKSRVIQGVRQGRPVIEELAIAGYRSLRDFRATLGRLTVVTGPNGSGKSSVYRALRLLAEVGQGRIVASLAAEGGLAAILWAGPETLARSVIRGDYPVEGTRRTAPVTVKLGFSGAAVSYAITLGLPVPLPGTLFGHDPEIKAEEVWIGPVLSPRALIAARKGPGVKVRTAGSGEWRQVPGTIAAFDSMLTHAADPGDAAELLALRDTLRGWRFYDAFRTDREAPVRQPQVGTRTPVLAGDGTDAAAAVQTILEIGDAEELRATVADAFAGASPEVTVQDGRFTLGLRQPGLLRPMRVADLSDGTLRYLLLAAALLSPRPPALLVLNEPEASLHPDLMPPLARLVRHAAGASQIVVVTHAATLADTLVREAGATKIELSKRLGETLPAALAEDEDDDD